MALDPYRGAVFAQNPATRAKAPSAPGFIVGEPLSKNPISRRLITKAIRVAPKRNFITLDLPRQRCFHLVAPPSAICAEKDR